MQNINSPVYRYKSVDAYRCTSEYYRRERLKEMLLAAFSFLSSLTFLVMFVKWWLI